MARGFMVKPEKGKANLGTNITRPMQKVNVLQLFVASFWCTSLPVFLAACCGLY